MKKFIYVSIGIISISVCNAYADVYCNDWGEQGELHYDLSKCTVNTSYGPSNCATLDDLSFITVYSDGSCTYLESCATCPTGYEKTIIEFKVGDFCWLNNHIVNGFDQDMIDNMDTYYHTCTQIVSCSIGWYGTTTNGSTGCTQCPEWSDVYTDSSRKNEVQAKTANSAKYITDCYIPSGTYYDVTGTFKINSNCYFKN